MWVPRDVWLHLASEVEYLRAQLTNLRDHERRMERKANGMSELAAEPKRYDPVPHSLLVLCGKFATFGPSLLDDAKRAHAAGKSWDDIEETIIADLERQAGVNG